LKSSFITCNSVFLTRSQDSCKVAQTRKQPLGDHTTVTHGQDLAQVSFCLRKPLRHRQGRGVLPPVTSHLPEDNEGVGDWKPEHAQQEDRGKDCFCL